MGQPPRAVVQLFRGVLHTTGNAGSEEGQAEVRNDLRAHWPDPADTLSWTRLGARECVPQAPCRGQLPAREAILALRAGASRRKGELLPSPHRPRDAEEADKRATEALFTVHTRGARPKKTVSSHPQIGGSGYRDSLVEARFNYLAARLAEGSRRGYDSAWRWWVVFCHARSRDPFLLAEDARERLEEETLLLDFITCLAHTMNRTAGTTQGKKVMGVRHRHLLEGPPDPLRARAPYLVGTKRGKEA